MDYLARDELRLPHIDGRLEGRPGVGAEAGICDLNVGGDGTELSDRIALLRLIACRQLCPAGRDVEGANLDGTTRYDRAVDPRSRLGSGKVCWMADEKKPARSAGEP